MLRRWKNLEGDKGYSSVQIDVYKIKIQVRKLRMYIFQEQILAISKVTWVYWK